MGKKKKRKRGKSIVKTAFKFIRLGALIGPGVGEFAATTGPIERRVARVLCAYGGYNLDGNYFDGGLLARMWLPFLGANVATYGIPKVTNIIRKM